MPTLDEYNGKILLTCSSDCKWDYTLLTKVEYISKYIRQLRKGNSFNQNLQS